MGKVHTVKYVKLLIWHNTKLVHHTIRVQRSSVLHVGTLVLDTAKFGHSYRLVAPERPRVSLRCQSGENIRFTGNSLRGRQLLFFLCENPVLIKLQPLQHQMFAINEVMPAYGMQEPRWISDISELKS